MPKKILNILAFCALICAKANAHEQGYLPLGDGHVSTSPKVDYVFSCSTKFGGRNNGHDDLFWIVGDKWKPSAKPQVKGSVMWPEHYFSIAVEGDKRVIKSNDLPDHATGIFPISSSDFAYSFDRNPNSIIKQSIMMSLPLNPKLAANPSCLPMGMIGIATNGVIIFNSLDREGHDAVAHEIQDSCNGHPQERGAYHYHNMSPCIKDDSGKQGKHSDLFGFAIDGFGIYGKYGENGKALSNKDLDACHGHKHLVTFNGVPQEIYHYHMTDEYPYTLGCFRGQVEKSNSSMPAKKDGPWPNQNNQKMMSSPDQRAKVMEKAAQELGIDSNQLRQALGAPPPDFSRAAQILKIDENKLRDAFQKARQSQ